MCCTVAKHVHGTVHVHVSGGRNCTGVMIIKLQNPFGMLLNAA